MTDKPDKPGADEHGDLWQGDQPSRDPDNRQREEKGALFKRILDDNPSPPADAAAQAHVPPPADDVKPSAPAEPAAQHPRAPSSGHRIRLVNVSKSFGSLRVLDDISMDIEPGRSTVIIGPSGVGKSVLLKHIVGLLKPDRGEVWFGDQRVDTLRDSALVEIRKRIGYLFQMGALFDSMNVFENVTFPMVEHTHASPDERRQRCARVLAMVGLSGIERKMPGELSGGQRKRVALARAIVLEPELVLYDEPTTGLDPIRADVINELILNLGRQLGMTSIVVTHDMHSADRIADRMVMLYDGRIVADGEPAAFYKSDADLVQRFVRGQADQEDLDRIREGFEAVR